MLPFIAVTDRAWFQFLHSRAEREGGAVDEVNFWAPRSRAVFWPRERWIPWGEPEGWAKNIVQGKTERDLVRAERLLDEIKFDELCVPEGLDDTPFTTLDIDERTLVRARDVRREGQGTFRSRLLDAYGRRCAITGEHTEILLDAAHIQPYLGPRSNHVQNGLVLTKEFHTLFDKGYVTVTPDLRVCVSRRLEREWNNGKRYSAYDGQELKVIPSAAERPARCALEWHAERVFVA